MTENAAATVTETSDRRVDIGVVSRESGEPMEWIAATYFEPLAKNRSKMKAFS